MESYGDNSGEPKPGTSRVGLTLAVWTITAGLMGLGWLVAEAPFTGLGVAHPINLVLFGLCLTIAITFTAIVWLPPVKKSGPSPSQKTDIP